MQKIISIIYSERIYIGLLLIIILFNILTINQRMQSIPKANQATLNRLEDFSVSDLMAKLIQKKWLFVTFIFFTLTAAVSFIVGIFLLARFFILQFLKKQPVIPRISKTSLCPWGIKDVIHVILLILFFTYCAGFVLAVINLVIKKELFLLQIGILDIVALLVMLYFIKRIYKKDLTLIGLGRKTIAVSSYWAIISYVAFIPIFAAVLVFNTGLMNLINYQPSFSLVFGFVLEEKNPFALLLFTLQVAVLAPFAEELFFRGFLYNALKKNMGIFFAAAITAVFFAVLHQELFNFIPIVFLGLLLIYVYEKTGSLWAAVVVHSIHNLSTTCFILFIKSLLLT